MLVLDHSRTCITAMLELTTIPDVKRESNVMFDGKHLREATHAWTAMTVNKVPVTHASWQGQLQAAASCKSNSM